MINPQLPEQLMTRTKFHSPKGIWAIQDPLYIWGPTQEKDP